jgi:hypothetical protein
MIFPITIPDVVGGEAFSGTDIAFPDTARRENWECGSIAVW